MLVDCSCLASPAASGADCIDLDISILEAHVTAMFVGCPLADCSDGAVVGVGLH